MGNRTITALIALLTFLILCFAFVKLAHATTVTPIFGGGTGTSTLPTYGKLLVGDANGNYELLATSSLGISSGSGTVTSIAASVPGLLSISGSPITTSGTLAITYSGTALPIANGGTDATSFTTSGAAVYYNGTALVTAPLTSAITYTYASSTAQTTTSLYATNAKFGSGTGLALLTAGVVSTYSGASACSNQFVTALSASGVTTCASINNGDWSGTQLSIANGGTNATSFTTSGNGVYYNGTSLLTAPTTGPVTYPFASSTAITVSGALYVPQSASSTLPATGQLAVQTGAASSSLQYQDGTTQRALYDVTPVGVTFVNYPTFGTGTSTVAILAGSRGMQFLSGACTSWGGTATVGIGNGSATSSYIISSNSTHQNPTTLSSNNKFDQYNTIFVAFGNFSASGTTTVACSYDKRYTY